VVTWIALGVVVAVGIAILVAWGWVGFLLYAFLAAVAAVVMWGAGLAGRVTREISRGRFADRER
jgi:hypothetical protein